MLVVMMCDTTIVSLLLDVDNSALGELVDGETIAESESSLLATVDECTGMPAWHLYWWQVLEHVTIRSHSHSCGSRCAARPVHGGMGVTVMTVSIMVTDPCQLSDGPHKGAE